MLAAYFDDSGTHLESSVVTWGGFIATSQAWHRFDALWRAELSRPLGNKAPLSKFSLSKCRAKVEEFGSYTEAESDHLQYRMREIITHCPLLGMAYGTDRKSWDTLVTGDARKHFGDAETVCFSECFRGAIIRARAYWPDEKYLSLCFDLGRKSPKLDRIVSTVQHNYSEIPELTSIAFEAVEIATPLQAADVLATENYWHAQAVLNGNPAPREHLRHFLSRASTDGYVLDEPAILKTLRDHGFVPATLASREK